jgi:hypothetical protein
MGDTMDILAKTNIGVGLLSLYLTLPPALLSYLVIFSKKILNKIEKKLLIW